MRSTIDKSSDQEHRIMSIPDFILTQGSTSFRKDASLKCLDCGSKTPISLQFRCCHCDGVQKVIYPLPEKPFSGSGIGRFAPLLPVITDNWPSEKSPLQPIKRFPGVWAKNDGLLPTGNTKFRQAAVSTSAFLAGKITHLVVSSTGNSSNSYCHAANSYAPELKVEVFVPETHQHRIHKFDKNVNIHVQNCDFVETGDRAKAFAAAQCLQSDGGFFNPFRREGLKTAYLEAIEQFIQSNPHSPNFFVQAISSGMGVLAAHSAFTEAQKLGWIDEIPAMIGVQQSSCAPIVHAYNKGHEQIEDGDISRNPTGLAEAILRGNPSASYPYVKRVIESTKGTLIAVSKTELRSSKKALREEGIQACYAASATLAGWLRLRSTNHPAAEGSGVIMITGSTD
jgi:threonine synthase